MKLKIAIVGFGGQGGWHAKQIMKNEVAEVVGVCDIKPSRLEYAKENGIPTYATYEDLLAGDADVVVVATPNDVHKSLCIKALRAGKHVVCEKPVTLSVADFDEIVKVAKECGKVFEVHQNRRWDTDFLAIKNLIATEQIGKPLYIASYVQGSRGIPGDWRQLKAQGGGMILDWGVHMIDQMFQLVKSPITSLYCKTTHYTNAEVDDGYKMFIYFENGVVGYTEVGTYNFISQGRYYAQFEQGTAFIPDWHDDVLVRECLNWGEGDVHPVQTASGITKTMAPRSDASVKEYRIPQPTSDVHDFYRNLKDTIEGKAEQLVRHGEVRRVLQVMEAAFASAASNTVVKFDPAI